MGRANLPAVECLDKDRCPTALASYLGLRLYDAAADLPALNPYDGPDARELFDRFLAWTNPRPPA